MEHDHILLMLCVFQSEDRLARFIHIRITSGGNDDANGTLGLDTDSSLHRSFGRGGQKFDKVFIEQRQDDLCFRIAEAAVVFHDFRSGFRDHQSHIQTSFVGKTFIHHSVKCRCNNRVADFFEDLFGHDRRRCIRAHPAGIFPLIPIKNALVVLRGNQRREFLSIRHCKYRRLFTDEVFLNDNARPRFAEYFLLQHHREDFERLLFRFTDKDAFPCRESACFQNNGDGNLIDEPFGIETLFCGERAKFCSRDIVFLHELLCKNLIAFKLCRAS